MFRRWTFGQVLFVLLAVAFLLTGFWGISQSKMLLSEKQMREVEGGADPTVTLTPLNQSWLPFGNATASVTVNITGYTSSLTDYYVNFTLESVSYYPGYCMNAGNNTDADVKFTAQDAQTGISWPGGYQGGTLSVRADFTTNGDKSFHVKAQAFDQAAYGVLYARLYNENDSLVSNDYITIPRDDNGNFISDGWDPGSGGYPFPDIYANWTATEDTETYYSSNNHTGDELGAFVEYRGFRIGGANPTDLSPYEDDLFIYIEDDPKSVGVGFAEHVLPPIVIHEIGAAELKVPPNGNREVTFNRNGLPGAPNAQYALWIVDEALGGPFGCAYNAPGTPKDVYKIGIDYTAIEDPDNGLTQQQQVFVAEYRVGHEIGHGMNLTHCQNISGITQLCMMDGTDPMDVEDVQANPYNDVYHDHHWPQFDLSWSH